MNRENAPLRENMKQHTAELAEGKPRPDNVIQGPWVGGDPLSTRVPEGLYTVAFISETERKRFGRTVFDCIFEIIDGPAGTSGTQDFQGWRLVRFLTRPAEVRTGRNALRSNLSKDFRRITGLMPPRRLHVLRPREIYSNCQLAALVRFVERDADGELVPEGARYSAVKRIVGLVAGSPPILQRRSQ